MKIDLKIPFVLRVFGKKIKALVTEQLNNAFVTFTFFAGFPGLLSLILQLNCPEIK